MSPHPDSGSGPTAPSRGAGWQPLEVEVLAALLPEYEVLSLLGRGGMGAVYCAVEKALDRPVALKLLPSAIGQEPGFADRFIREARAMARLNHPRIATLHTFGRTTAGHLYFTMEYVEGRTLASVIREGRLDPGRAIRLAAEIGAALAYAHDQGVVHRDVKPANVLLDAKDHAKVVDFGLARLLDPTAVEPGHTASGITLGTPEYMAPEQKRGREIDARTDLYSLGVLLYEMLCGEPPQGAFEPPSRIAGCTPCLDRIVERAMQSQPERRYASAAEMVADLEAAATKSSAPIRGPVWREIRKRPWSMLAIVACLGVLGIALFLPDSPRSPRPTSRPPPASSEGSPWVDALAAVESGEIPVHLGSPVPSQDAPREFRGTNLVRLPDGAWKARRDFFLVLPTTGASLRDQALRITFRGRRWAFGVRRNTGVPGRPFSAYELRGDDRTAEIRLGMANLEGGFEPLAAGPWPAGFDWEAFHTVELRAEGHRLTATLDGQPLLACEDDRLAEGAMMVWGAAGAEVRRLEHRQLGPRPAPEWVDMMATLRLREAELYRGPAGNSLAALMPTKELLVNPDHLVEQPNRTLRASCDLFQFLPFYDAPLLRDQALRATIRGEHWVFELRRTHPSRREPGAAVRLVLRRDAPGPALLRADSPGAFEPVTSVPWPAGYDWDASHSLEFRAVGSRISVRLDGKDLFGMEEAVARSGLIAVWTAAGGAFELLEYADLGEIPLSSGPVMVHAEHRYQFVSAKGIGWQQARARAETMGGHLATITDRAEADFVAELCDEPLGRVTGGGQVWLGAQRIKAGAGREGWAWVTGEPFEYQHWAGSNPDSNRAGEALALMRGRVPAGWNDFERPAQGSVPVNMYIQGFVVEWETPVGESKPPGSSAAR